MTSLNAVLVSTHVIESASVSWTWSAHSLHSVSRKQRPFAATHSLSKPTVVVGVVVAVVVPVEVAVDVAVVVSVGAAVGDSVVGACVGVAVGDTVGNIVGAIVGVAVGGREGAVVVGASVGAPLVGVPVGVAIGADVATVGALDAVGAYDGVGAALVGDDVGGGGTSQKKNSELHAHEGPTQRFTSVIIQHCCAVGVWLGSVGTSHAVDEAEWVRASGCERVDASVIIRHCCAVGAWLVSEATRHKRVDEVIETVP
jgi:hypothetical protein